MPVAVAADGYRLWFDAVGDEGLPALVLPARFRAEFASLGAALADRYRVIRYKPRRVVDAMEAEEEAGGPWEPAEWVRYPLELEVADLHTVADAAGAGGFVLAGYSGMAALAGFLAPVSDRVRGLVVGGFPLLASCDYWLGFEEGARAALVQAGLRDEAADHHLGRLLFREWGNRDDRAALAALPGPKVLWYGSRDSEPDCRMYDFVGGAAIARHIRAHADALRAVGFELIEIEGQDHIGALATTDVIAPRLLAALGKADW
ncbi:alpha/beta fold hydrolase [Streptomyces sp. CWNU-52B]|uniref:alpha/beta fold hydrolase n=1 Tax=unclassified Streptomyces TaxID=2593676 RepID=UPI0039BF07A9